jgi:hypothetical protein
VVRTNSADAVPPAVDATDDYPVDHERVKHDLGLAQKAVVVHQSEQWPRGTYCRNCHAPWPCRLYRWGHAVLRLAEWCEADIAQLAASVEAGALPWW